MYVNMRFTFEAAVALLRQLFNSPGLNEFLIG